MTQFMINPTRTFEAVAREFDSGMKNIIRNSKEYGFYPKINIIESEKKYIVKAELPGIAKEKVSIAINEENILTISGEKENDFDTEASTLLRAEINYGKFERKFQLPDDIIADSVTAKFINGVLELAVPSKEPVSPKEINISIE